MSGWLGALWAGVASGAFALLFNVRGRHIPVSALGGAVGWAVYLAATGFGASGAVSYFAAAAVVSLYAETASRLLASPAGTYVACAIIPLVPGGGMYRTMSSSINGDLSGALSVGFETLGTAGAIAAGLAIGSVAFRLSKRP